MKVQNAKVGQHIGFGGEFYTLWNVDFADDQGNQNAVYHKNISTDLEEAVMAYPNATVSGLKGEAWTFNRDSEEQSKEERDHNLFQFGKYAGEKIIECTDLKYLSWYEGDTYAPVAKEHLLANGYVMYNDDLISQEKADNYIKLDTALDSLVGEDIEVKVMSNINSEHASIKILSEELDSLGIYPYGFEARVSSDLYFDSKERHYNGFNYRVLSGMRSMKGDAIVTIEKALSEFGNFHYTITKFEKA